MQSLPVAPVDSFAADRMWAAYAAACPGAVAASPEYTVEHFGDSQRLANELLGLVLSGRKRATAELVADFIARGDQVPRIGSHWIACDGDGVPRIIIRSTELRIGPFTSADAAFARDEGEDDLSLDSWQREHRRYWTRVAAAGGREWSESDEIVFERFDVVWPPEYADARTPRQ
ncbi:ASCH domain-containing protein [Arthrobacter sp. EPSL27]|uniref:ASCH domain-containing protein n=1 Tax=Arthrobacter sp. EPSL27 TaxID=1745378 RepID=UPI000746EAC1|nr:ASCH domain-containing protein [Arthrobacter sp. EPSL27]KUM38449.1 asch domain superfamily protein [Arthrobacter sp. EPSL27]